MSVVFEVSLFLFGCWTATSIGFKQSWSFWLSVHLDWFCKHVAIGCWFVFVRFVSMQTSAFPSPKSPSEICTSAERSSKHANPVSCRYSIPFVLSLVAKSRRTLSILKLMASPWLAQLRQLSFLILSNVDSYWLDTASWHRLKLSCVNEDSIFWSIIL